MSIVIGILFILLSFIHAFLVLWINGESEPMVKGDKIIRGVLLIANVISAVFWCCAGLVFLLG